MKEKEIIQHILNTQSHVENMLKNFKNEYKVIKNNNGEFEYVKRTYIETVTAEDGQKYTLKLTGDVVIVRIKSLESLTYEGNIVTYKINTGTERTEYTFRLGLGEPILVSENHYIIRNNTFKINDIF